MKRLVIVLLLLAASGASGQTLTTLYSFTGSDGFIPEAGLVQGSDGNFYGTTRSGGQYGSGTVFRISPNGNSYTILWSFCTNPLTCSDGASPYAGLVQSSDGSFYGTTEYGGTSGSGAVFRISPSGSYTNLYSFSGSDGAWPSAGLVQGSDGNFYGTTWYGGTSTNCSGGCGTVFQISPSGTLTTLYSFSGTDGFEPWAGLVRGSDGNFYGTTWYGGTNYGGTVFRISSSGSLTTLHSFNVTDGFEPVAGLVQGSDGSFYGTTYYGGTSTNCGSIRCGTVFQISPSGTLTTLYSFTGGEEPGRLVQGSDGNLYGTTYRGGLYGSGTVFRTDLSGNFTNLYSFSGSDGANPLAGLVQGSDGNFYGTTEQGGTNGSGTAFRFSIPLSPPANQIAGFQLLSIFGSSCAAILIPSVAGETYQLQYTDSMNPTNWINSGEPVSSIGGPLTTFDLIGSMPPQRFYRFVITP